MQEKRISISQLLHQTNQIVQDVKKDDMVVILTYFKEDFLVMVPVSKYKHFQELEKKSLEISR